ncbi:MAG: UPF0280 family protein [bacterium]
MTRFFQSTGLITFEAKENDAHLLFAANQDLSEKALPILKKIYNEVSAYAQSDPEFVRAMSPRKAGKEAPAIIKEMVKAAQQAKVGPMATVAGAIAEAVGKELLTDDQELIIENGGDIFVRLNQPRKMKINDQLALELDPQKYPYTVSILPGPKKAFSFGKADTIVVIAKSGILADAAATAIGNEIKEINDIERGLNVARKIKGLNGVLIIKDGQTGILGKMKLVPLN